MTNGNNLKPQVLPVIKNNVPEELKKYNQWVVWKHEWNSKEKKYAKVPKNPITGRNARSNDSGTWTDYDTALRAYENGKYDGIGFETTQNDPFLFWDLDQSVDLDGHITEAGFQEIVVGLASYTELSPSGTGLRIVVKANKFTKKCRAGWIEVYNSSHYLTITGQLYRNGLLSKIEERQNQVNELLSIIFEEDQNVIITLNSYQTQNSLSDDQILAKAFKSISGEKIRRLYDGDISDYGGDHSAADQALCFHLAFWFNRDPVRVDSAFRSSRLIRPKWDEVHSADGLTYGQMTIGKATQMVQNKYEPKALLPVVGSQNRKRVYPLTDTGNGERFADQHRGVHYCHRWGKWLVWDGCRWKIDTIGRINLLAKDTVRSIYTEASNTNDDGQRSALGKWAFKSEAEYRKKAMLISAQSEPEIPLEPDDLDKNAWLLNVQNGTLDLKSGHLLPHQQSHLISKICPVAYDPSALSPAWDRFLNQTFAGNRKIVEFIQRAVGYSMTGIISEQCLFFFYGIGSNGKTTLLETISTLLGDYAIHTDFTTFLKNSNIAIRNDLARIKGARFVLAAEADKNCYFSEALLKRITGGEPITARFLHQEFFEYQPEFKIFLSANHKPRLDNEDDAIWRRIRLVPFNIVIAEENQDKMLIDKLRGELPGILNWVLKGCLDWQKKGLAAPSEIILATNAYREEMDTLTEYMDDCLIFHTSAKVARTELYSHYLSRCHKNNQVPLGRNKFNEKIAGRGYRTKDMRVAGKKDRFWVGIGLKYAEGDLG